MIDTVRCDNFAVKSNDRKEGIMPKKQPDIAKDFRDNVKIYYEYKEEQEYERIMKIPKDERTFSERMFVSQYNTERILAKAKELGNSMILYSA